MDQQTALESVLARRERARSRSRAHRVLSAATGGVLALASLPLLILLPELGVPALVLALRLLADEFDWAARAYAWVVWRWSQVQTWYHGRSRAARALIVTVLLVLAALVVWLLVHAVA